jgi:AAA+ superfamily predicted ATPase
MPPRHADTPDTSPTFALKLPPNAHTPATVTDVSLLPLTQRWLLAAIRSLQLTERLLTERRWLRHLQIDDQRIEELFEYAEDIELSLEEKKRLRQCQIDGLLAQVEHNIAHNPVHHKHPIFYNVDMLGNLLGLSEADKVVVCLLAVLHSQQRVGRAFAALHARMETPQACAAFIADLTQVDRAQLQLSLATNSTLRSTGLIKLAKEGRDFEEYLQLSDGLDSLLLEHHTSPTPLVRHFFTPRGPTLLRAEHFPHLSQELKVVSGILRGAMRQGLRGTNVLLYGPPGVGKTELATLVACALDAEVYEVAYADADGEPISGMKRLASYNLCQRLLSQRRDAVVVFDEVDDMLRDGEAPSKAWVNRALEENPVPAIWITNSAAALDPAYRRRFDYSIHMKTPPRAVRRQIAQHHLHALTTPSAPSAHEAPNEDSGGDWLDGLAENPSLTPGQMERAAKVVQLVEAQALADGDLQAARACADQVLQRSALLMEQVSPRHSRRTVTAYDMAYLNTDVPMDQVVAAVHRAPSGSFCFYGPPGSGKTALAQHIAHQLELPVVLRRASDLLSKYVGGSEQQIAAMFEEAQSEPCVLILDEADSFLQARATARHSWEITQVNELLTQMEAFDGLFICTTNLLETLDPAALRRFDWKIAFHAMTAAQRWAFFLQEYHLLGGDIATAQPLRAAVTQQLGGLTPGDVAPVIRQFRQLQCIPTAQQWFERLRAELATRRGGDTATARHAEVSDWYNTYAPQTVKNSAPLAV